MSSESSKPQMPEPASLAEILDRLNDGNTAAELEEGLREVVARARATGKKGQVTLIIKIKPASGKTDSKTCTITDEIKLKLPEHDRAVEVFFMAQDGSLAVNPFHQQEIDFDDTKPKPVLRVAEDAPDSGTAMA